MKLDYLCIGVQKSGTNSLINYMNHHPEIYMADGEPGFSGFLNPLPQSDSEPIYN